MNYRARVRPAPWWDYVMTWLWEAWYWLRRKERRRPATCAICAIAEKGARAAGKLEWWCANDLDCLTIPCTRGKLPNVPRWCPKRGGKR